MRKLIGSGGGESGGSSGRHEATDSLRSKQVAHILDLISEGEVEGFVTAGFGDYDILKSVVLDGTVVQNDDGSYNFTGVSVDYRTGTQAQSYVPGFPSIENEIGVSAQVKTTGAVVRTVTNTNVDAVRVTLFTPRLTYQDSSTGDLQGTSVDIAIDVQTAGGGFVQVLADTITGKTTGKYQRAYRVDLPGAGPWDIRVRRITADSSSSTLSNDTWWGSYTEIIDGKLRYPNSAVVGIKFDSQQFNSIPSRGYLIKGVKVQVPYNYNPITREYAGAWDGTFLYKWTDNPAWVFYDMATNPRYGLGEYVDPTLLDKWTLYTIAQYCDGLVPDGFGGTEPRFTCNLYIQTREEAFKVMQNLASIFRGIMFWGGGGLATMCDMPADPVMAFTNASVLDGAFEYSGTDRAARHTVALVTWNDPSNQYKQTIEYVEDLEGINLYGVKETEVVALGCTSRGQANRFGRWVLNTNCRDTEAISFKCGIDGTYLYPGSVFEVGDRNRHAQRVGGRVISATTSAVTIDSPVELSAGVLYSLSCVLPDGSVETKTVSSSAGTNVSVLNVFPTFSDAPQNMSSWVLSSSTDGRELWKVVALIESEPGILQVQGITYRPTKFAEVESGLVLQPPAQTTLFAIPSTPTNLSITETLYQTGSEVKTQINVSWDGDVGVYWEVSWLNNSGNWQTSGRIYVPSYTILDVMPGSIDVRVSASSTMGMHSEVASATHMVVGKTAPPVAVQNFTVSKVVGLGVAEWAVHADLDVRVGGKIVVRHAQETTGATWSNSVIVAIFDGNTTTGNVPLMTGTYMAKARDSSGNWSLNEVSFVVAEGMANTYTTVFTKTENPTFSGAKTNTEVVTGNIQLTAGSLSGEYAFSNYIDMTTVATRRFEADVGLIGFLTSDYLDDRPALDDWSDIDGGTINDGDATLYAATTNDDPAGTPTWGSWTPFFVADFTCRAIKFKLVLERGSAATNTAVGTLHVDVKVPV